MEVHSCISFVSGSHYLYGYVKIFTYTFNLYLGYSLTISHNLTIDRHRYCVGNRNRHDLTCKVHTMDDLINSPLDSGSLNRRWHSDLVVQHLITYSLD